MELGNNKFLTIIGVRIKDGTHPPQFKALSEHLETIKNTSIVIGGGDFKDKPIYEQFKGKDGYKIIIYANFKFYQKNEWKIPDKKKFIYYYNITGNVYDKRQILLLSDETNVC